jgi:ferrous iron transport protein B
MPALPLIAFAGNPNSGKTSLFNAITRSRRPVANYPGVTVEVTEGEYRGLDGSTAVLVDLPGAYSLSPYSPEELVARAAILDRRPMAIVCVVDASNLERNLYLYTQLAELGIPCVIALNMMDELQRLGREIDVERLADLVGAPVVPTIARRNEGCADLMVAALAAAFSASPPRPFALGSHVDDALAEISEVLRPTLAEETGVPNRFVAVKLLENDPRTLADMGDLIGAEAVTRAEDVRLGLGMHLGDDPAILVAEQRYGIAAGVARRVVTEGIERRLRLTQCIDAVVTQRVLGIPILVMVLWVLFEGVFRIGSIPMGWIEAGFGRLSAVAADALPHGLAQSFVVDGLIGGVGGVLVFLPQVVLMFLAIALLEDTGYLARAAFVVDRVMQAVGLQGRSFIPMLLGFGCSVPALLATRALPGRRDRMATLLVIPFMSCSGRLPIYALFVAAFFRPEQAGIVVLSLYGVGVLVAVGMARVLRSSLFRGEAVPFLMELPPYRAPTLRSLVAHTWDRAWMYVQKAGTTILAMSIVVWAACSFPHRDNEQGHSRLSATVAGMLGHAVEPVMAPCGFGWKQNVALVTGLAAKEVVVSTLGTLYGVDEAGSKQHEALRGALANDPAMSPLKAYAFLVFVLLYVPCVSALAMIRAETGQWRWVAFALGVHTSIAWLVSVAAYQGGRLLGLS